MPPLTDHAASGPLAFAISVSQQCSSTWANRHSVPGLLAAAVAIAAVVVAATLILRPRLAHWLLRCQRLKCIHDRLTHDLPSAPGFSLLCVFVAIAFSLTCIALIIAWLDTASPTNLDLWLFLASATVFGTIGQVLSLLQLGAVRRHMAFRQLEPALFVEELTRILRSVKSKRGNFYWYCTVHDPCHAILLGTDVLKDMYQLFSKTLSTKTINKHLAMLPAESSLLPPHAAGQVSTEWSDASHKLIEFEANWLNRFLQTSLPRDQLKSDLDSAIKPSANYTNSANIKPAAPRQYLSDRTSLQLCLNESVSHFRRCITANRDYACADDDDADVHLYPIISDPNEISMNMFFSDSRGLLAFFEYYDKTRFRIYGMTVENENFIKELKLIFSSKCPENDANIHLKKQ